MRFNKAALGPAHDANAPAPCPPLCRRAAHADAIAAFRVLLGELVKEPDAAWRDWAAKLRKDPQVGGVDQGFLRGFMRVCGVCGCWGFWGLGMPR